MSIKYGLKKTLTICFLAISVISASSYAVTTGEIIRRGPYGCNPGSMRAPIKAYTSFKDNEEIYNAENTQFDIIEDLRSPVRYFQEVVGKENFKNVPRINIDTLDETKLLIEEFDRCRTRFAMFQAKEPLFVGLIFTWKEKSSGHKHYQAIFPYHSGDGVVFLNWDEISNFNKWNMPNYNPQLKFLKIAEYHKGDRACSITRRRPHAFYRMMDGKEAYSDLANKFRRFIKGESVEIADFNKNGVFAIDDPAEGYLSKLNKLNKEFAEASTKQANIAAEIDYIFDKLSQELKDKTPATENKREIKELSATLAKQQTQFVDKIDLMLDNLPSKLNHDTTLEKAKPAECQNKIE